MHQIILPGAHTSLTWVSIPILTVVPLQYFSGYFSLAFLEGYCPSLSLAAISLHLDPATWDPSVSSNRAASSSSTSSWSCWRYSNFFFSSTILYFSVSFLALAFTFLLAFWTTHSTQWASTASCKWRKNCLSESRKVDLVSFIFSFLFLFLFSFQFISLFFYF